MWTLLVLCSVIAAYGVQGYTTVSDPSTGAPCGGQLYGSSGTFYSPGYPNNYPHNANCIWYIRPGRRIVQLEFPFLHMEICNYDTVEVYDGSSISSRFLGKVCGTTNATFHSTGDFLTVRFRSDGSGTFPGFRAHYRVVAAGSCRYNCGYEVGSCSCSSSCEWKGNCCPDYRGYCANTSPPTAAPTTATTSSRTTTGVTQTPSITHWYSCRHNCGLDMGICSCTSSCQYYGNCCYGYNSYCPSSTTSTAIPTTGPPSCRYNCGRHLGSCSCSSSCQYNGNCCYDYYSYCSSSTASTMRPTTYTMRPTTYTMRPTTGPPSCRYNCGRHLGSCSCSSSCQYNGNCCYDYYSVCYVTSATPRPTTGPPSCRYNCGRHLGSCSCSSSCQYNGNCCYDYYSVCYVTSATPRPTTGPPSCRYNCGRHLGSCSCSSSCQYNGNCCYDYYSYCSSSTASTMRPTTYTMRPTTYTMRPTTGLPSCRYNCGRHLGSCSCSSSCQYNGNCCYDYYSVCYVTSATPRPTTGPPSCRYNCGRHLGSCSCSSSCQYNGNCCYDYYSYCSSSTASTMRPTTYTMRPTTYTMRPTTGLPSCRYNCGRHLGSCSCSSSCQYNGNCCYDYYSVCYVTSATPRPTTGLPSCRYNCGRHLGSCSCSSSCQYNGNCCYDYYSYCSSSTASTMRPTTYTMRPTTYTMRPTTGPPSCRYNCGRHLGSCSCSSSCQYNGNCCYDYYSVCYVTSAPPRPTTVGACGGSLVGSGNISSPNYPNYYYDNSYCTWQLRTSFDQRIFLTFTYLQLENCCSCDHIAVYDGPSVGSRYLGTVCNNNNNSNTLNSFYSTSNYMTVLFRTDGSVVGRGFSAEFISTLPSSSGQVDCSSDNMNIVIERSYLNSLGYNGQNLYLNDPHCRPQVSNYRVVFSFPINTCGNVRQFVNGRVVYSNTIRGYTSNHGEITRQSHLKLNVACRMEQDSLAQIMYRAKDRQNGTITGTGRFNTSMDFYTSSSFYDKVTQVPYKVSLNQNLYVQLNLRRGDSSLVLFLDTCVASPSPHDFQSRAYFLVRNGCPVDNTYYAYISGTRAYTRFTFKAFQFLRATDSVYIQCKVLICPASDLNSRCRRGCSKRVARDLGSRHETQTLVLGPIQLKEPEKKEEETQKEDKA